jgi:YHS domain-containing protein
MKTLSLALSFLALAAVARAQEDQLPTAPPADAQAVQKINALGGGAMPLAANTNLLSVNFSLAGAKIDDAALESLKGVSEQLVWLNLANTSVTDAGLKVLAGFKNLRRLHLEKTGVGDEGLTPVKNLAELQYLNLYGTKVTDKGLASLASLKKLKNVYLWQTAVTDAGAAELAKAVSGIYINRGIDPPAKVVEIAAPPAPAPAVAAAKPINAKCPLTGKDIDGSKTSTYKTQLIAFCCDNCKGKFDAEPAKFIGKVAEFKEPAEKKEVKKDAKKAFNAKCPRNDLAVDPAITLEHKGVLIAFCSEDCKTAFPADPEKYINRYPEFKAAYDKAVQEAAKPKKDEKKSDAGNVFNVSFDDPINKKCPLTGKDVVAGRTSEYEKQLIGFCCMDCVNKFESDPKKYIGKVKEFKKKSSAPEEISFDDPINKKCPLTGKEIVAGRTSEYEKQLIGFCCADCVGKFESDPKKYIGKVKEFKKKASVE